MDIDQGIVFNVNKNRHILMTNILPMLDVKGLDIDVRVSDVSIILNVKKYYVSVLKVIIDDKSITMKGPGASLLPKLDWNNITIKELMKEYCIEESIIPVDL